MCPGRSGEVNALLSLPWSGARAASVLALINADGYADLSIGQIRARELDEGRYGCSV